MDTTSGSAAWGRKHLKTIINTDPQIGADDLPAVTA